jgi:hypothetical protein
MEEICLLILEIFTLSSKSLEQLHPSHLINHRIFFEYLLDVFRIIIPFYPLVNQGNCGYQTIQGLRMVNCGQDLFD